VPCAQPGFDSSSAPAASRCQLGAPLGHESHCSHFTRNDQTLATARVGNSDRVDIGAAVTAVGNAGGAGSLRIVTGRVTDLGQAIDVSDGEGNVSRLLGLIETMKVYNEVLADERGRLVQAHAASGQLVQQGEVLFTIDPRAPAPSQETP